MTSVLKIANPRNGDIDCHLDCFDLISVQQLAAELRQGQKHWLKAGMEARIAALQAFSSQLVSHQELMVEALSADTGRYQESVLEVEGIVSTVERWCRLAPEILDTGEAKTGEIPFLNIRQDYQPYPLVGVISPWNFPLLLSLVDAIPALLAGSAVMIKPSEFTSRFVLILNRVIAKVPALNKVLSIITGAGETGSHVTEQVDLLCFTGSVNTGRKVGEQCAKRFIPAFLELGGKDAAIVCADADLQSAASAICWGSMVNAGQSCMSLERVYVHRDIYDEFAQLLRDKVARLGFNYPDIKQGEIGPIITAPQAKIVRDHLADAKAKGAEFLTGGAVLNLGGGNYCQPTLVTQVTDNMSLMTKETFAAILPLVAIESDEQAIELTNDSDYGLSAAVFSANHDYALQIAEQLNVGAVSINDASLTALVHEAEKHSFNYSGLGGSRMGPESIKRFIRKKAYLTNTGVQSPWWFK